MPAPAHYGDDQLLSRVREALSALDSVTPLTLAPLDQFHIGGTAATVMLAEMAAVAPGELVLDVGCGLGGPARILSVLGGAEVTGIDLAPAFCEVATLLNDRCGLAERVSFQAADALALPFDDACFDLVWSQYVSMNIADRARLYREMRRVLKPGGRIAVNDVVSVDGRPPHFPVPWARDESQSHLVTTQEMQVLLADAGFDAGAWRDTTPVTLGWGRSRPAPIRPSPLGLHLVLGPDLREMVKNLHRAFEEGRLGTVMAVARAIA